MKERHKLVLVVLGGIFVILAIFLVITLIQGDDTAKGGAGMPALLIAA